MATRFFGLECKVFMVRVSFEQKPYRKAMMQTFGAQVTPSPSTETQSGRAALEKDPNTTGSLSVAISEAVEMAVVDPDCRYALGSVLNHVLLHQTVIGLETMAKLHQADDWPDIIVGCTGGGSNFAGIAFPFIGQKLRGEGRSVRIIAVEPAACPTLTRDPLREKDRRVLICPDPVRVKNKGDRVSAIATQNGVSAGLWRSLENYKSTVLSDRNDDEEPVPPLQGCEFYWGE